MGSGALKTTCLSFVYFIVARTASQIPLYRGSMCLPVLRQTLTRFSLQDHGISFSKYQNWIFYLQVYNL